nr:MAG TPA: hypothetical protein [Bacteriophage sp.]
MFKTVVVAHFNITVPRRNACSGQDDVNMYLNILIYKMSKNF